MNAYISSLYPKTIKHAILAAVVALFFVPDTASACSWDAWPCFGKKKVAYISADIKTNKKKYYRARRADSKKYHRRVAALKQGEGVNIALPIAKARTRRTIGKIVGRGKSNRRKYLPILKRVKPRGLPMKLAMAVVTAESNWRAEVTGSVGEVGLMQIRTGTARWMGGRKVKRAKKEDVRRALFKPEFNLRIGTKYLYWCYRRAKRDVAATIGCYNRGPGRMWSWHKNAITKRYVSKVRRLMRGRVMRTASK